MNFGTLIRIYSPEWRWAHSNLLLPHELGLWILGLEVYLEETVQQN